MSKPKSLYTRSPHPLILSLIPPTHLPTYPQEDYEDAIVDYEEENHLYASCLNATAILESAALEVMWTRPVGRTEDCFRDCLNFGIANLTDRTPADSVKAVYDTNTTTGASRCSCLTHRGDQNIPIDTRCNPDEPIRPGPTVYVCPSFSF